MKYPIGSIVRQTSYMNEKRPHSYYIVLDSYKDDGEERYSLYYINEARYCRWYRLDDTPGYYKYDRIWSGDECL